MGERTGKPPRAAGLSTGLVAITLLALFVRMWGVGFGLPFLYHTDEAMIVDRALRMPVDGPNPHWFQYPTLYLYIQAFTYAACYTVQRALGAVSSYSQFLEGAIRSPE